MSARYSNNPRFHIGDVSMRKGRSREIGSHRTAQTCVSAIDLDINIHVRKRR
ncbi:hypothetical protein V5279_21940 [Bradyrhizobium sp. 26S5]|uniref:hypothetical protein n=1 Tax=Bradyrhizobium sp. 26S5 TaxID=3139729 RepID=UPI0030CC3D46